MVAWPIVAVMDRSLADDQRHPGGDGGLPHREPEHAADRRPPEDLEDIRRADVGQAAVHDR
ncbi:MAG: hypothetical protein AAF547_04795, partial [Actinomycetota bacterium]